MMTTVATHQVVQKYDGDVAAGIPPTYVLSEAVYDGRGLVATQWELIAMGNLLDVIKEVVRRTALVARGKLRLRATSRDGEHQAILTTPKLYFQHWMEQFKRCRLIPLQDIRDAKRTGESPLAGEVDFFGPRMKADPDDLPAVFDEWAPSDQANPINAEIDVASTVTRSFFPLGTDGFFFWKTADDREMVWTRPRSQAMLIRDIADCLTEADQAGMVPQLIRKQMKTLKERPEIDWDTHEIVFRRDPTTEREARLARQVKQGQKMSLEAFAERHCEYCEGDPADLWEEILTDSISANPLCALAIKAGPKARSFSLSQAEGSRIQPVTLI